MSRNMSDICQQIVERYLDGDDDAINDFLSDTYGWLVIDWCIE